MWVQLWVLVSGWAGGIASGQKFFARLRISATACQHPEVMKDAKCGVVFGECADMPWLVGRGMHVADDNKVRINGTNRVEYVLTGEVGRLNYSDSTVKDNTRLQLGISVFR